MSRKHDLYTELFKDIYPLTVKLALDIKFRAVGYGIVDRGSNMADRHIKFFTFSKKPLQKFGLPKSEQVELIKSAIDLVVIRFILTEVEAKKLKPSDLSGKVGVFSVCREIIGIFFGKIASCVVVSSHKHNGTTSSRNISDELA